MQLDMTSRLASCGITREDVVGNRPVIIMAEVVVMQREAGVTAGTTAEGHQWQSHQQHYQPPYHHTTSNHSSSKSNNNHIRSRITSNNNMSSSTNSHICSSSSNTTSPGGYADGSDSLNTLQPTACLPCQRPTLPPPRNPRQVFFIQRGPRPSDADAAQPCVLRS